MLLEALSLVHLSGRVLVDFFPNREHSTFQSPSWLYEDPSFLHKTVALIPASWILSLRWLLLRVVHRLP